MAVFRGKFAAPWPVLAGILIIVILAWGMYASRFSSATRPTADAGRPSESAGEAQPSGAVGAVPGPTASVTVNAPSSIAGPNEMNIKPGAGPSAPPSTEKSAAAAPAAEPVAEAPPKPAASPQLEAGRAALARGDLLAARVNLSAALKEPLPTGDAAFARSELERMADALIFSRAVNPNDPLITTQLVGGGDSLNVIAQKYKITEALLASINRISDPNHLEAGRRLKIIRGPFSAVIDKAAYQMDVYLGDVYVRGFRVGLGTNDGTPRGTWVVRNKLINPEWIDPTTGRHYQADDPDNPIGERWIGLHCLEGECLGRTGFGLHGTIDPSSIGRNMSMGCIRLSPEGIAFVYDLFVDGVSRVVVR